VSPTRAERMIVITMRALVLAFVIVGLLFLITPDGVIGRVDDVGNALGSFSAAPRSSEKLWLGLAVAYCKPHRSRALIDQRPNPGSAGCVGTHTSGAEGGGEQTTARKRGMAARLRPYIATVRAIQRNVKNWQSGDMALRWTAAGMLEAESRFRKVEGYRGLANLAIENDLIRRRNAATRELTTTLTV
jgi:hypothetical protein